MKAKIAVVTVSGKAYYLIVDELKRKTLPFLSLTPGEPVPVEIEVVITTQGEMQLVSHKRLLLYKEGDSVESLITEASQITAGKEHFVFLWVCNNGNEPGNATYRAHGAPYCWTNQENLLNDTIFPYNDPNHPQYCFIGFQNASVTLTEGMGTYNITNGISTAATATAVASALRHCASASS